MNPTVCVQCKGSKELLQCFRCHDARCMECLNLNDTVFKSVKTCEAPSLVILCDECRKKCQLSGQTQSTKTTAEIIKEKKAVKEQSDATKSVEPEATDKKEDKKEDEVDIDTLALFLLQQGDYYRQCGKVPTAIFQFEKASRLLAAKYGEISDQVADAYFSYGSALLETSRIGHAFKERIDANTQELKKKKSDDKAEEEIPKSQINDDANGEAKPVKNGHTNGVNGHSTTNVLSETNGAANPKDTSNCEEKQNDHSATYGDKETEEKAIEDNKTEDKKPNAKEMETDKPKDNDSIEEGEERKGIISKSKDLEGEAEPQDREEQDKEDKKVVSIEAGAVWPVAKSPVEMVTSLQLAWEMLELSKIIYSRGRTMRLKHKTSKAYLKLGEVGLESGQYLQAIGNFKYCLQIQQELYEPGTRNIAETHYSIGVACCFYGLYDESISNYESAFTAMKSDIDRLKAVIDEFEKKKADGAEISVFDDPTPETKKEMNALNDLLPAIRDKIQYTIDEQNRQKKVKKPAPENAMDTDTPTVTTGFGVQPECSTETSDQSKFVSDITQLVREKRKQDDEEEEESTKKAKVEESDSKKEESKPEESKPEDKKQENDQNGTDEKMDAST